MRARILLALFVMTLLIGQTAGRTETDSLKKAAQTLHERLNGVSENLNTLNSKKE